MQIDAVAASPDRFNGIPASDDDAGAGCSTRCAPWYVAATNDDTALFHTVAAPDFYAYDAGRRFAGDELMAFIRSRHEAGVVYVWRVTEPEVRVDGGTAWITYVNRGSITDVSGAKDVTWLESAVLRKEKDVWRIQFFHSTRVP